MKRYISLAFALAFTFSFGVSAQVPLATGVQILKAEDARAYDATLENLLKSPNADVRKGAALAAGRIGDERAIPALAAMLEKDQNDEVRAVAAFALGETESVKAAEAVINAIKSDTRPGSGNGTPTLSRKPANVTARLVEAAGKIAAANPKDESAKSLGRAIVDVLNGEADNRFGQDRTTILLGLTAILRTRPEGGEVTAAKFLLSPDGRIRSDAGNTMTRLRAKNASATLRDMLDRDREPTARANAARALGAAEDKTAYELLLKAATADADSRVRVSAIRALASLKEPKAVEKLVERGNFLLIPMHGDPAPPAPGKKMGILKPIEIPLQKNELFEIATAVGRLLADADGAAFFETKLLSFEFLVKLMEADNFQNPEPHIAAAKVAPKSYIKMRAPAGAYSDFHIAAAYAQGMAEIANQKDEDVKIMAGNTLKGYVTRMATEVKPQFESAMLKAMPDLTRAMAALKPDNLDEILRNQMTNDDVFIRAATAEILADRPMSKDNFAALEKAFTVSLIKDKFYDDAMLAIMDALAKLDKKASTGSLLMALNSRDYLVRKKAFELLDDKSLEKDAPGIPFMVKMAREKHEDQVQPYQSAFGTKLGQLLNSDIDYKRALSRKNGSVSAVLTTEKGTFTIVFNPEEAPLTVDNWVKLARSGYFNGLEVHRVVPNFVMQDGDPRGDGNGGPGWSIRCEVNMLGYDRGAVGMALSGKDTGGSQWFVTHSPQPHLDGGYTVFGHVDETGMKVVDNIVRGDKILKVTIVGK